MLDLVNYVIPRLVKESNFIIRFNVFLSPL